MGRKALALESLEMRARRLLDLIRMKAPNTVIEVECSLIFRGGLLLSDSSTSIANFLVQNARSAAGFCLVRDCQRLATEGGLCDECNDDMERQDASYAEDC